MNKKTAFVALWMVVLIVLSSVVFAETVSKLPPGLTSVGDGIYKEIGRAHV